PGFPADSASWTSQQSVSNLKSRSKCARASPPGAAAIAVTLFGMQISRRTRGAACRAAARVAIGTNAIYDRNHAKAAHTKESPGRSAPQRESRNLRARNRGGDLRPAPARD